MMRESAVQRSEALAVAPPFREHPSRLFVETTSRCNLSCAMCMKQSAGGPGGGADLDPATFDQLAAVFPWLDALVLNGVGEPLLHRHLESFIRRAKMLMPSHGWIGFQSNGLLMTNLRAMALVDAGVDRVCLSVDGASPETFRAIRGGHLSDLEAAVNALAAARESCSRPAMQIGIEIVAMRENLRELPLILQWAASRNVSFALVSHLLPYDAGHAESCAYSLCTVEAEELFGRMERRALAEGVDLRHYFRALWKFRRTPEEQRVVDLVDELKQAARKENVTLDLRKLLAGDRERSAEVAEVFEQAREVARQTGLDLRLPEAAPRERRYCSFIENGGAFVSCDGKVHPCYYLWHDCRSHAAGWMQRVRPKVFGDLAASGILDIWNGSAFRNYRETVVRYAYPFCPGCATAPCDYVEGETFEQDCYANAEPCGSCLWSSGMFQCLG